MRLLIGCLIWLLTAPPAFSQNRAEQQIRKILDGQTTAWNTGDLDGFMIGYWQHDSLMYIGKSGITYGYAATLKRYKENYGDTARMGKLTFDIRHLHKLSARYYQVVGRWSLRRSVGDAQGYFSLLFRKIRGSWVIVADHSS